MSSKKSKPALNNPKKGGSRGKKKPQPGGSGRGPLAPVTTDPRFAHVHKDPRFTRPRKQDTKVAIDQRFAHMLREDFSDTPKVDRYGRKLQGRSSEADLKRYYKIQDEDEDGLDEEDQEEEEDEDEDDDDDEKAGRSVEQLEKELEEDESNEEEEGDEMPMYDPARGEGVVSSSEGEDDDDDDDAMEGEAEDEDKEQEEILMGDESHRLAVVNLDWDHVKAVDLFKIFNGFKPNGSVIRSVRVYPSEFGKERMAKEEAEGPPKEIFKKVMKNENESAEEDEDVNEKTIIKVDDGEEFDINALRRYQLDRLKYYYALIDCDTVSTARSIYQACDGAEFERSANFFDMRYVPDEMEFEDEPRDEASHAPENYRPVNFTTDVLQHSKVKLTWDEDDPDRVQTTRRKFTKEDIKEMDFRAYLASSSDDDSDENDPEETRQKYRSLLAGGGEDGFSKAADEKEEGEMEITFTPGLSEKAAKAVERRKGEEVEEDETTIEKYMRKMKDKRKAKKLAKNAGAKDDEAEEEGKGGETLFSDDDIDMDTSDPFFADALKEMGDAAPTKSQSKSTAKRAAKKNKSRSDREADAHQRAELELLMSDGTGTQRGDGFDMREVLRREKAHGKKKGKKGSKSAEDEDDFEIDVADPRFAAVMESHHFAIDPTNPQYKKTKAMARLQEERRKRQAEGGKEEKRGKARVEESTTTKKKGPFQDPSLSLLVESVKRKAVMATTPQEGKRKKAKI